jgi:hypothetical protein
LPTARQFLREAAGRYVALDGRLWRALWALVARPGFLTREYFAGRRRRYIRPARLFLVMSVLLFAALRFVIDVPTIRSCAWTLLPGPAQLRRRPPRRRARHPPRHLRVHARRWWSCRGSSFAWTSRATSRPMARKAVSATS